MAGLDELPGGETQAAAEVIRVRVAPSPTGDPHVGTAYAALFNRAFARSRGGSFILRIEDTDRSRYVEGSEEQVFDTLRWLGLTWDEGPDIGGPHGPYRQSERLPRYREVAGQLVSAGRAYYCWCSPERLAEMRFEQQKSRQPTGYDRLCLGRTREERAALPGFSEQPVIRMRVPDEIPPVTDLIRGQVQTPHPDDQVLLKADGFPTYHLAVVVDDHDMGITHVIRGEDWLSSTSKHILLYDWMDWRRPQFAHFSLLRNADRSKISKRKNPAARLKWFQEEGFLPAALINFLALMGYSMPSLAEVFTFDEMVATFDLSRLSAVGPVFDIDKLDWLNGHYLRALSDAEFLRVAEPFLPPAVSASDLRWIATALRERTKRLAELPGQLAWLHDGPVPFDLDELGKRGLTGAEGVRLLDMAADALAGLSHFEPAEVEESLDQACAESGASRRRAFMTVRIAVTGGPVSPPLHETIATLGRDRTVTRLRTASKLLSS